jgi:hypothetical protein
MSNVRAFRPAVRDFTKNGQHNSGHQMAVFQQQKVRRHQPAPGRRRTSEKMGRLISHIKTEDKCF